MNAKRISKMVMTILAIGALALPLVSCASQAGTTTAAAQTATVQRGTIKVDITGTGNLTFSKTADLAFETAGTVKEVMVGEGDSVTEGQVLASLDPTAWQDNVATLERNVTQAQINANNAQATLDKALNVYTWPDLETAQGDLDNAKAYYEYALQGLQNSTADTAQTWQSVLFTAKTQLKSAQTKLDALLTHADSDQIVQDKLQLELVQGRLQDAQKALDEAKATSPQVKATFDGFITKVNVAAGDEINKGAIAVTIADPAKFEADVLISEMNIYQVKDGGDASVEVNALPLLSLPAKVTHISPTATISQGVVNYTVTITLQSLQTPQAQGSQLPDGGQRQSSGSQGQTPPSQSSGQTNQRSVISSLSLKQGLSVTISILVQQKENVLMVPTRAITRSGRDVKVEVKNGTTTETRTIKTGISNGTYTEVTEGLNEGDVIVLPTTTSSTSTTNNQQRTGGTFFMPGIGR